MLIEPIGDRFRACLRQITRSCILDLFHDWAWRFRLLAANGLHPQELESKPPSMLVSYRLPAESVFFLVGHERLRSEHLLQSRVIRLFLLYLLRLICLFTL